MILLMVDTHVLIFFMLVQAYVVSPNVFRCVIFH